MGLCARFLREKHIAPMLCALCYMGFASIGYYTIPLMLMGEMYPLQVSILSLSWLWRTQQYFKRGSENIMYYLLELNDKKTGNITLICKDRQKWRPALLFYTYLGDETNSRI